MSDADDLIAAAADKLAAAAIAKGLADAEDFRPSTKVWRKPRKTPTPKRRASGEMPLPYQTDFF